MATMTYREALNLALSEEMRRDGRVFVIGGGLGSSDADEGTLRLLDEFDPRRVVHTHIAESGFAGVGIGAAMVGLRPVVELMTFDFVTRALDQIVNTAARLFYVSGGQYNVPIVIRGRGDPVQQLAVRHPQSMARYFVDLPGLKVVGPSTPAGLRRPRRAGGARHGSRHADVPREEPRAPEDADAREDRGRGASRLPCERELSGRGATSIP